MIDKNIQMNNIKLVAMYTHAEPFDDEHSIIKTFEIYVAYDVATLCTRIIIRNADTKRECDIYLDYIQTEEKLLIKAARKIIDTNLLS